MENEKVEEEIDILELLKHVKKNIVLILILGIVFAAAAFAYAKLAEKPMYEASVNMIVNTRADASATVTNDNINSATKMVEVYGIIIKSNTVLYKVIDELGLDISYSSLNNSISVSSVNNTQVMKIVCKNESAEKAGEIVSKISQIAPNAIVEAVDAGSCKVINNVEIGTNPVSPKIKNYLVLGFALGVVLGLVIVFIKVILHNTIINEEDIEKYLGLPVLGIIPEIDEEYHG